MKRQIFISLILLSSILSLNAQIYTPSGTIQGSSGNNYVGIGTTTPQANADITTAGAMSLPNTSGSTNTAILRVGYYNHSWAGGQLDMGILNGSGYPAWIQVRNPADYSVNRDLLLNPNGGFVGIGTISPQAKLHIDKINGTGIILSTNSVGSVTSPLSRKIQWGTYAGTEAGSIDLLDMSYSTNGTSMVFTIKNDANALQEALRINWFGNIGIGTATPAYKLDVCGTIRAKEIKVDLLGGCDFVFKTNYKLMDLKELEGFVKTNQHLPEIDSEKEMVENGVNVNEFQMKLLQKIEELTLYTIEQNKKIIELEQQNKKIEELKQMVKLQSEKIEKIESDLK